MDGPKPVEGWMHDHPHQSSDSTCVRSVGVVVGGCLVVSLRGLLILSVARNSHIECSLPLDLQILPHRLVLVLVPC